MKDKNSLLTPLLPLSKLPSHSNTLKSGKLIRDIEWNTSMAFLPNYRPKQLSLGPLETEILHIVWDLKTASVKDVHERILLDPERELAYTSVTTVLKRLTQKAG